jgi:predicted metal-dependent peptidase
MPEFEAAALRLILTKRAISQFYYTVTWRLSDMIPTACIDGRTCWVNPKFFISLTAGARLTVLFHELGHKFLKHNIRRNGRDPFWWNVAGDHVINLMAVQAGFEAIPDWICDPKYTGMTTEQVYDALLQEQKGKQPPPPPPPPRGPKVDGPQPPGPKQPCSHGDEDEDEDEESNDAPGDEGDDEGDESTSAGKGESDDDGQPGEGEDEGGDGASSGPPKLEGESGDPKLDKWRDVADLPKNTPEERRKFEDQVNREIRVAADIERMGGHGGIFKGVVQAMKGEPIAWDRVLVEDLKKLHRQDFDWGRRDRRQWAINGVIAPAQEEPAMGGMVLFIDTSGSISDSTLGHFQSRINEVIDAVHPQWIDIVYFDTRCYKGERFERGEVDLSLRPVGRGGTDFRPMWDYLATEQEEQPDVVLVFTDMFALGWGEGPEDGTPVYWIATSSMVAPFGKTVHIQ